MSDSWDPDESDPIDVDTFQEWLHYTAESRNLDEGELLNRLVSAYWILDEMSDVVPDTSASESGPTAKSDADGPIAWESSLNRRRPADESADTDVSRGTDHPDAPTDTATDESRDPAAPADTGTDESGATDAPADSPTDDPVAAEIQELRNSIQTQLGLVQTITELRRQVSDLSLDVEQQRSRQDGFTDRITDDLTRLNRRVEQLDAQVGDDAASLDDRLDAVERALDDLESTYDEFETWVDGEFDEIEALFQRVIERSDGLDDRLVDVERTTDTVEDTVEDIATARRSLGELRREAIDLGIDEGTCDHCGSSVDLSMLTDPTCPGCDRPFSTVTPGRWWNPLSGATLHTASDTRNANPTDEEIHPRDIVDRS